MSSDALYSAIDVIDVEASPAETVNLQTLGSADPKRRRPAARAIRPLADGTLRIKTTASDNVIREIAVKSDVLENIQATTIEPGTDVACRVYW